MIATDATIKNESLSVTSGRNIIDSRETSEKQMILSELLLLTCCVSHSMQRLTYMHTGM